jgi:preprotein translocase subunit SecE
MAVNNDDAVNITATVPVATPNPPTIGPIKRFLREVEIELRKTKWPSRDELMKSTVVVVVTIILVALFLWVCDQFAGFAMTHVGIGSGLQ